MTYQCNSMLCRMKKDLNNDPSYWLGAAFFSGFLFSTWSWGILYLLSFLIIWELGYYIYCYNFKENEYDLMIRIGIFAGSLMGFLMGRAITETDDHEESIQDFLDTMYKYTGYKYKYTKDNTK